jgi:hypothetical protein
MGTRHREFTVAKGIHKIQAFEYADAAARAGATGLTAADVGKVAIQLNSSTFWLLQNHSPVTWQQLGEVAATSVPVDKTARVDGANGSPSGAVGDLNTAFNTIAGALAAVKLAGPSEGSCYAIEISPGTYTEPTLELDSWIIMRASSGGCSVTIQPATATGTIVVGAPNAHLEGVRLTGANGLGGYGILHSTAGGLMVVTDCIIDDCETGAFATDGHLVIRRTQIRRLAGQTMALGAGSTGTGRCDCINSTSIYGISGGTIAKGVFVDSDGASMLVAEFDIEHCGSGVQAISGGAVTARSGTISSCTVGLDLPLPGGPGPPGPGAGGSIDASGVDISDCEKDFEVVDPGASLSVSGVLVNDETSVTTAADFFGQWLDGRPTERSVHIEGGLRVGSSARPTDIFVNGGPHVDGVEAFRNVNGEAGPWEHITDDLFDPDTPTAIFSATSVGAAFYIGNDIPSSAFMATVTALLALGTGAVQLNYWNADIPPEGDWAPVTWMTTDADSLESFGSGLFNSAGELYTRLGNLPGWEGRELGVPSFRKLWLQLIITSAIDTVPIVSTMALLSDAVRFSTKGVQYFGTTRPERVTPLANWNVGSGPANENLLIASDITEVQQLNKFGRVGTRTTAQKIGLPIQTDTSLPAQVKIEWHADGSDTGLGIWYVRALPYAPTAILDGTALSVEQSVSANGPGTAGEGILSTVEFDISQAISTDCWNLGLAWERRPVSPDLLADDMVVRRIDLVTRDYK